MSRRRAIVVAVLATASILVHPVLVRAMAHGHVAHVLLGSGNAVPPIGAALLAISLVVVRFVALVIAPGALLAALASVVADVVVGRGAAGRGGGGGSGSAAATAELACRTATRTAQAQAEGRARARA